MNNYFITELIQGNTDWFNYLLFWFALVNWYLLIHICTYLYSFIYSHELKCFWNVYSKCINIWTATNLGNVLNPVRLWSNIIFRWHVPQGLGVLLYFTLNWSSRLEFLGLQSKQTTSYFYSSYTIRFVLYLLIKHILPELPLSL